VEVAPLKAKEFLENKLNIDYLKSFFPSQESVFGE
jgi:hypothetical protein